MQVKFFSPDKEYQLHRKEYLKAFNEVRSSGRLVGTGHKEILEFEKAFAEYVGVKYAIGVSSGTDAIMMSVKYLKPKKVLVPYYTFKATISAVMQAGAKPIFNGKADVGIVAHIAGEIFPKPKTKIIIEDSCQAIGAVKNPKTFAQVWSFYPAKILGIFGDAAAITTNDKKFYEWVKEYQNHFKETNKDWGGNHRLDNVIAKELLIKLKRIDKTLDRRKEIAEMYLKGLKDLPLTLPNNTPNRVFQDFIINVGDKRDKLYDYLKANGVETLKNEYSFPIPKSSESIKYEKSTLRLPINEVLEDEEVLYVIEEIKEFYGKL